MHLTGCLICESFSVPPGPLETLFGDGIIIINHFRANWQITHTAIEALTASN